MSTRATKIQLATALVLHPDCGRHDTGWGHPDHQGRLPAIVKALEQQTPELFQIVLQHQARPATEEQLRRVHDAEHVARVRSTTDRAATTRQLIHLDPDTLVSPATWDAAVAAAGCAIDAVELVMTGRARTAFALSRPPGHHAFRERATGFCVFNNVAVAARAAQAEHGAERVLIIDWDVHHGNGTQAIFYEDASVHYVSVHLDGHYPQTGAEDEHGAGAGKGSTRNVPLRAGTPVQEYLAYFYDAVGQSFEEARPDLVLISAGFDCLRGDPLGGLLLEPADLHRMTRLVMREALETAQGRVVAVLEGGYAPQRVASGVVAVFRALAGLEL